MNNVEIQRILPHRYPFLFLDRVVEVSAEAIHAQYLVSNSNPILQGHFPGFPILPGVIQVEAMAQAAIILTHVAGLFDPDKQVCFFMGIDKAKFRAPVTVGDVLEIHVTPKRLGRVGVFEGVIKCGQETRSQATFTAILRDKPSSED